MVLHHIHLYFIYSSLLLFVLLSRSSYHHCIIFWGNPTTTYLFDSLFLSSDWLLEWSLSAPWSLFLLRDWLFQVFVCAPSLVLLHNWLFCIASACVDWEKQILKMITAENKLQNFIIVIVPNFSNNYQDRFLAQLCAFYSADCCDTSRRWSVQQREKLNCEKSMLQEICVSLVYEIFIWLQSVFCRCQLL